MDGYDSFAGNEQLDDMLNGNDPSSYDSLSNFQGFDDILTNNQGYGWDTDNGDGTVWATGDPSTDASNFGYGGDSFDANEQQFDDILTGNS